MLRFLTAGESHGPCLTAILEGVPAGLPLSEDDLATDMVRRQGGYGRGGRMKIERDRAEIMGGVTTGATNGGPIALRVENRDWAAWKDRTPQPLTVPRPGHADWAGGIKYAHKDFRPVLERASARETAARVAVGAVCKRLLTEFGITVYSEVVQIGTVRANPLSEYSLEAIAAIDDSPFRCSDPEANEAMKALVDEARARGDTLGGVFEVVVRGLPPGLGSYVHWDKRLDGRLAQALMSIQAIKGVEVGDGFAEAARFGTEAHDHFVTKDGAVVRATNRAGGTEGGVTNGQPVVVRAAMKPISTTISPQKSVDLASGEDSTTKYQRSDICAVPAAAVVGEAMVAYVIAGVFLEKFGGDSVRDVRANLESYLGMSDYWLRVSAEQR